jgi:mannose-1-phosphate guanylyltransferase
MYAVIGVAPPRRVFAVGIPSVRRFIEFMDMPSLLRQAFERIQPLIPLKQICVLAPHPPVAWILSELPELPPENLWWLPGFATTTREIGWAAMKVWQRAPEALMVVMPENHLLDCDAQKNFCQLLQLGASIVRSWDALVIFGTAIPSPEAVRIGEGVILGDTQALPMESFAGRRIREGVAAFPVKRLTSERELAPVEDGKREGSLPRTPNGGWYVNRHTYLWRAETFLQKLWLHQPEVFFGLKYLHGYLGMAVAEKGLLEQYTALPSLSLEEGVLAHAQNVWVVGTQRSWYEIDTIADLTEAFAQMEREGISP